MLDKAALIIDDSATARTMLKYKLNKFDVMVESAADGFEALQLLQSHQPDVIFLDHIMPGMDGFQVLQQLKSNPLTQAIPVVMYTSQAAPKYTVEAKALGAIGVMPKQVTNELLSQMLDRAEQYQQGIIQIDPTLTEIPAIAVPDETSMNSSAVDQGSSTDPVLPVVEPQAARDQTHTTRQRLSPLTILIIFLLALSQGYWLYRDQQQQQAMHVLQATLADQQQQYQLAMDDLDEQRQANQSALAQFQFVMDALVTQVLQQGEGDAASPAVSADGDNSNYDTAATASAE